MYLRGLHNLVSLILDGAQGQSVSSWIAEQAGIPIPGPIARGPIETQAEPVRTLALAQAFWLTEDWPSRFIDLIVSVNLRPAALPPARVRPAWQATPEIEEELAYGTIGRRSADEIASAREVLKRRRSWPPSKSHLEHFLRTGETLPIRPIRHPVPQELQDFVAAADRRADERLRSRAAWTEARKEAPREIYRDSEKQARLVRDPLPDLDDTTERLSALRDHRRNSKAKPPSE